MNLFSLTFLAPLAFLGLMALAIPIYLHLRHRPRAIELPFGAMDFLLSAQKKRRRRLHVEQRVLMALRLLALCLLVLIFARPLVDESLSRAQLRSGHPHLFILDDSASMLAGPPQEPLFQRALQIIRETCEKRPSAAPTHLIMGSDPNRFKEINNASSVLNALNEVRATARHITLNQALSHAIGRVNQEGLEQATIQIITDGTRFAWDAPPAPPPEGVRLILTPLTDPNHPVQNTGLVHVDQMQGTSRPTVQVTLLNSRSQASQVPIRIHSSGGTTMTFDLALGADERTTHQFALDPDDLSQLTLELPDDGFLADNQVVFPPAPSNHIRVLLVEGDTRIKPRESEAHFIRTALDFNHQEDSAFEVETLAPTSLKDLDIRPYDVICLLNVASTPSALLSRVLAEGKGVLITLGDRVDTDHLNAFLSPLGVQAWETTTREPFELLTIHNPDHPVFSSMDYHEWEPLIASTQIRTFGLITVGRAAFDLPLTLSDGTPLLLASEQGPGRLLIWASSADLAWNDFPLQVGFLPMVRNWIRYLAHREIQASIVTKTVDDLQSPSTDSELSLIQAMPFFRNVAVEGAVPGIYAHTQGPESLVLVTLDPRESDFKPIPRADEDGESASAWSGFQSSMRADLAPPLIWILFFALLAETLLAARISLKWGAR